MEQTPDSPALAAALAASAEAELNPLPQAAAPPPALVPELGSGPEDDTIVDDPPPPFDVNGFDPADYKWLPVRRKPRKDGWTPQRQRDFIAALADYGCVAQAADEVRMTTRSCYRLRREPGAENFAAAWDAALQQAARGLVDLAFDRAIHGSDEPVFDREGRRVGRRMRQNDRLLMFLLRAYMPERFRHAHRDMRMPDEALPPAEPPMDEALARLAPVMPPEPHTLLPPDELEDALLCADLLPGKLPHWHRGQGDNEPVPVNHELERRLEEARHDPGPLEAGDGAAGDHAGRARRNPFLA